jgi:signal transduction histidine kinase
MTPHGVRLLQMDAGQWPHKKGGEFMTVSMTTKPAPHGETAAHTRRIVLVVDDDMLNRQLLRDMLEHQGYEVAEAQDGEAGLACIPSTQPNLILLDVMMPGMDGFEVCRRLKRDANTAPIPVIMITSLSDRTSRLQGIESGASDFLTRPIDRVDVSLRVRNALEVKRLYDQAQESLTRLKDAETLRDNLVHLIVHDLRTPLQAIVMGLDLIETEVAGFSATADGDLRSSRAAAYRMNEMIAAILDVNRLEAGQMPVRRAACDMKAIIASVLLMLGPALGKIRLTTRVPDHPVPLICDPDLVERVIGNLVSNAVRFMPKGGDLTLAAVVAVGSVKVSVIDTGPGIATEYHQEIFEKFGQVEMRAERRSSSTGLGLAFCRLAVEAHGGRIGVESEPGRGSTFWFALPTGS